ncbi:MAG TPA: hypothetical protein VMU04_02280 [Candidatus Acidoferrum sp.]|nr:hypothetical protein [Candidatus Acidoferrum sp.]
MTKLIAAFIIILVLFGGWHLFHYWEKVRDEKETRQKQQAAAVVIGEQLPGMPDKLAPSLEAAKKQGAAGLRNWLKTYGRMVQDPRKAWIELDYCVLVSHEDLPEARRVFAEVKARTPESSPVWPRVKDLEKVYQ